MTNATVVACCAILFLASFSSTVTATLALKDPSLPDIFYPFGTDEGDTELPANDDWFTSPVDISVGFPFFNNTRRKVYVNTNGALSFDAGVPSYTPDAFPVYSASIVAPYWCDVDTRLNNGRVYYRETTNAELLAKASRDIQAAYAAQGIYYFQARWLFITTWHNVTYYGGSKTSKMQSFQAILTTDGVHSFALFNYGTMTWTSGTGSGGSAATGLGGTPAQVGFNAGDSVNFYAIPWSRTPEILNVGRTSNIGTTGRWAFRIDSAQISPPGCSRPAGAQCMAWQEPATTGRGCIEIAPPFDCPVLSGPTLVNSVEVEFYCTVRTNVTDRRARFDVWFTFDGETFDDVPVSTVIIGRQVARLRERYLHGRLGKWIGCKVVSFWENNVRRRSQEVRSTNSYRAAIEASASSFVVKEGDDEPYRLTLRSTLPIACQRVDGVLTPSACEITLRVSSTTDIAVRQRYPGSTAPSTCSYVIRQSDWKAGESIAYNVNASLEVVSKVDLFMTRPRSNKISFRMPRLPDKTVNGETYPNPWSEYEIKPDIQVYHIDSPTNNQFATCSSTGDPHITTFDKFYYHVYAEGRFIYARSVEGHSFEVQVRHWKCWTVSCNCAVAIREGNTVLMADMCKDKVVQYRTLNEDRPLPPGAGITISPGGHSFTLQMPSGNKVVANVASYGMNLHITKNAKLVTAGLCGYHDGNQTNDLKFPNSNRFANLRYGGQSPADFTDSWRVRAGLSLFDGYLANPTPDNDPSPFCQCAATSICGGRAVVDSAPADWDNNVIPVIPKFLMNENDIDKNGIMMKRGADTKAIPLYNIDYADSVSANVTEDDSNIVVTVEWPTSTGITQSQAENGCKSRIFTSAIVGPKCYDILPANTVSSIVQKCVDDVQIIGDFTLAADNIPELQRACINLIVTRNYTDINDTAALMRAVKSDLQAVKAFMCEPVDCSGHGSCTNGTCVCTEDYIGTDCAVSRSAIPSIDRLLDSIDCDVRKQSCQSVSMVTTNAATTVTCKVVVYKSDGTRSYTLTGQKTSPNSVACFLPVEQLSWFSNRADFNLLHGPGIEFNDLALGGAVLAYTVAISNDGQRYSSPLDLRLIDTLCMVSGPGCVQKPDTCLIHGYCFSARETNPYSSCLVCQPSNRADGWTSTDAAACPEPAAEPYECSASGADSIARSGVMIIAAVVGCLAMTANLLRKF